MLKIPIAVFDVDSIKRKDRGYSVKLNPVLPLFYLLGNCIKTGSEFK